MRLAVVGHVEWIRFCRVDEIPRAGRDRACRTRRGSRPAAPAPSPPCSWPCSPTSATCSPRSATTSSAVAAPPSSASAGCTSTSALDDRPTRWAFTQVDDVGERTITTVGPKLHPRGHDDRLPWDLLGGMDGVFFTAGDVDALVAARRARVLVATARELSTLRRCGRRARCPDRQRRRRVRSGTRSGELDPAPRPRRRHLGRARRLDAARRAVLGRRRAGPDRRHVRRRRLVHGRGHLRARGGARPPAAVAFGARCGAAAITGRGVAPQPVADDPASVAWHVAVDAARDRPLLVQLDGLGREPVPALPSAARRACPSTTTSRTGPTC